MGKQLELPTIDRIVSELDGSYMGTTLYGIVREMDWGCTGRRPEPKGESMSFYSPLRNNLRGTYSAFYYDNYPKKCLPTRSELEVEMCVDISTSLLVASTFKRGRDGIKISLYHRDGRCSFPIFGPKMLYGSYAQELQRYQQQPTELLPSPKNEESDMILLTHLALASAVSWRSNSIKTIPYVDHLLDPLQKMFVATYDYDQKCRIPPNAA